MDGGRPGGRTLEDRRALSTRKPAERTVGRRRAVHQDPGRSSRSVADVRSIMYTMILWPGTRALRIPWRRPNDATRRGWASTVARGVRAFGVPGIASSVSANMPPPSRHGLEQPQDDSAPPARPRIAMLQGSRFGDDVEYLDRNPSSRWRCRRPSGSASQNPAFCRDIIGGVEIRDAADVFSNRLPGWIVPSAPLGFGACGPASNDKPGR